MKPLLLYVALIFAMALPVPATTAQDSVDACPMGDFDCVARVLDDRLRLVLENSPVLLTPRVPPFKPNATVVSIAAPDQTDEDAFPGDGCGPSMRLTVKGQPGAIGYMQCGTTVIQCMVPRNNSCVEVGSVEDKAAGKCGIASTGTGPATALCESGD